MEYSKEATDDLKVQESSKGVYERALKDRLGDGNF